MTRTQFSLLGYGLIFIISFTDILMDLEGMGQLNAHIIIEAIMSLIALVAFSLLLTWDRRQKRHLLKVKQSLKTTRKKLSQSQKKTQKLMGELSKIIQEQFQTWQLTQSEKEIALLLLKGLTLEEIAQVRETKEKTVRQHASNLYKKAGLSGRHELVAYFFEDLLIIS
ncbi:MAG: LuxR C-terminal-related transcriptional regulator [Thiomicrorhabdus sp.]|nr:LuxR C-terminal-related transcriptional regulator [Thiomicrorhabdus sp.]